MIWAIGDIQGCYGHLKALLEKIEFDPKHDTLWIAGDLVNRGADSLETLRYLYKIRKSIIVVLGNHDIALIAAYLGLKKSNPSIDPILNAPDAPKLIKWLRTQKFFHLDHDLGYCMSHAGISPQFDLDMTIRSAKKIEERLHSDSYGGWISSMFDKSMDHFDATSSEIEQERYTLSSFVRMRFCYDDGRLEFKQKGAPTPLLAENYGLKPWFACSTRKKIELKIIFGHWSTLGYYSDDNVCSLDTGCVWDGAMTAMRLDGKREEIVQVKCKTKQAIKNI
ncbi:MAG: symmetrical bis(5'-nucleosyl)-tetraphosphatase [Campylobacterota bacterium]|nr:symmetrical bis(5'-nucleosyl)-tetraphosphatase [Campylobacterota bacterium]